MVVPALAMSGPSHGAWSSSLLSLPGTIKKGSGPSSSLQRWEPCRAGRQPRELLPFEPWAGAICNPATACQSSPDLPSRVDLRDRHKNIPKAKVCYTCSPSVGLGGRVEVSSVFPRTRSVMQSLDSPGVHFVFFSEKGRDRSPKIKYKYLQD